MTPNGSEANTPSTAPGRKLRVVKVGGSLFDLSDLDSRLRALLDDGAADSSGAKAGQRDEWSSVLIPGGGAIADAVRYYDSLFQFDERFIHDVAVETMAMMAEMLAAVTGWPVVNDFAELFACREQGATCILDVRSVLADVEPDAPGERLERSWAVTSDSISARIGRLLGAETLWLLKSTSPATTDLDQLVRDEVVDPGFPKHIAELPWQIFNLRD